MINIISIQPIKKYMFPSSGISTRTLALPVGRDKDARLADARQSVCKRWVGRRRRRAFEFFLELFSEFILELFPEPELSPDP